MQIFLIALICLSSAMTDAAALFRSSRPSSDYGVDQDGTAASNGNNVRSTFAPRSNGSAPAPAVGSATAPKVASAGTAAYAVGASKFSCGKFTGLCPLAVTTCERLRSTFKNGEALDYTLQYHFENYKGLRDSSCMRDSRSIQKGVMSTTQASRGMQNGKIILNDLDTKVGPFRSQATYIDLCANDIKNYEVNLGSGTYSSNFSDLESRHSTVAGAFLVDSNSFAFSPFRRTPEYNQALSGFGNKSAVRLIGLNSSNNSTDYGKPMHVSPYQSSWGCPSVNPQDGEIIGKMTSDGTPGLMMNYHKGAMQQLGSGASCRNGSGGGNTNSSGGVQ